VSFRLTIKRSLRELSAHNKEQASRKPDSVPRIRQTADCGETIIYLGPTLPLSSSGLLFVYEIKALYLIGLTLHSGKNLAVSPFGFARSKPRIYSKGLS